MSTATLTATAPYKLGERVAGMFHGDHGGTTLGRGTVTAVSERPEGRGWTVTVLIDGRPDPQTYLASPSGHSDYLGHAADFPRLFATERAAHIGRHVGHHLNRPLTDRNPVTLGVLAQSLTECLTVYGTAQEHGDTFAAFLNAVQEARA